MKAVCTKCHRPHTVDHYPKKWLRDSDLEALRVRLREATLSELTSLREDQLAMLEAKGLLTTDQLD